MSSPRLSGTIIRLMADKGFGFLADEAGVEYFFHRSAVSGSFDALTLHQPITFTPNKSPKGPRAEDVEVQ
jgi:cold shock protein